MDKIETALWQDYNGACSLIEEMTIDEGGYKVVLEERDKVRNELIKLEQINQEKEKNKLQIESDNKKDKIRNIISIGTFAITTAVSMFTIIRTFKFDERATVTSTLGRGALNGVIPKMLKR